MLEASLGARPRYRLVGDEDVKKPTKQTNKLSKVLERLVLGQLLSHLTKNYLNECSSQPIVNIIAQKPLYYVFVKIFGKEQTIEKLTF